MEKLKLGKNADELLKGFIASEENKRGSLGKHVERFSKFFGQYIAWRLVWKVIGPFISWLLMVYIGWKLIFKPLAQAFGWMS